jgi:hypothetical protein
MLARERSLASESSYNSSVPVPLTYDTLPPHSRLRREFADGVLKIIAAVEEPGPLVRRAALLHTALPAAMISVAALLVGFAIFGSMYLVNRRLMPEWLSLVLGAAFVVVCAALFALVWRIRYTSRLERIEKALRQSTIIAASFGRLLIETDGPFGAASHDLRSDLRGIGVVSCSTDSNLECLRIGLMDGTRIEILAGRDRIELDWVARQLVSTVLRSNQAP